MLPYRQMKHSFGGLFLLLFLASECSSQITTGTILGTVTDSSGAVIAGPKVRVTNENTNISVNLTTNNDGDYVAPNLPAATYSVQAESPGFRKTMVSGVGLLLNATQRQDLRLEPGMVEQEVTVTAEAPIVASETSSVASPVDAHAVQNLLSTAVLSILSFY